jgi:Tfp pilus assembly protein PilV
MKKNLGLTLIELLIASSIFMVVIVSIYSAFHTGIFGYRNIDKNIEIDQTARGILERMNLELKNSFRYSQTDTQFKGEKNKISFLTLLDTYREDSVRQDFAFVSYLFENKRLMRLQRLNTQSLNDDLENYAEMATDIESLDLSYITFDAEGTKTEKDIWDATAQLPTAVKIKLAINDEQTKIKKSFERTVFLSESN